MADDDGTTKAVGAEPIIIRYDGGDADGHELELNQLGESLQGFAKVLAVAANFAATGRPAQHYDALQVRVLAVPTADHRCFEIWATLRDLAKVDGLWQGVAAAILTPILAYIFSKRSKDGAEMKHLSDALLQSIQGNQAMATSLVGTVERLAEALNPSVRKALGPIDKSCTSISIHSGASEVQRMDSETKRAFATGSSRLADRSEVLSGLFTEFDMANGSCKVLLEGQSERVAARVLDPVYSEASNPYVEAMAAQISLRFLAKLELNEQGGIARLHILDTVTD